MESGARRERARRWLQGSERGLAYIHTELSHQHTGHSAGHTLCASTSPFTHAVSSRSARWPAGGSRVYAPSAILCVCARTRSEGVACLNLDGGGLALAERQRERGRETVACVAWFTLKRSLWCISFPAEMIRGCWDFDAFRTISDHHHFCVSHLGFIFYELVQPRLVVLSRCDVKWLKGGKKSHRFFPFFLFSFLFRFNRDICTFLHTEIRK